MSKLAQAGENSTVAPGSARAEAAATAPSSVSCSTTVMEPFKIGRKRARDSPISTAPFTRA